MGDKEESGGWGGTVDNSFKTFAPDTKESKGW